MARQMPNHRSEMLTHGSVAAIAVALLTIAMTLCFALLGTGQFAPRGIDKEGYQAVVLEGRQVYFGKLRDLGSAYVRLEDAYYEPVTGLQQAQNQPDGGSEVKLLKVGQDLPQAEPTLYISADKIVSWENLRDDSKIVKAIQSN